MVMPKAFYRQLPNETPKEDSVFDIGRHSTPGNSKQVMSYKVMCILQWLLETALPVLANKRWSRWSTTRSIESQISFSEKCVCPEKSEERAPCEKYVYRRFNGQTSWSAGEEEKKILAKPMDQMVMYMVVNEKTENGVHLKVHLLIPSLIVILLG